jgi:Mrp family chromosome partitioning ATPase
VTVRADAPTAREAITLANALSAGLRWYVSTAAPSSTSTTPAPTEVRIVEVAHSAARVRPRAALSLAFGAAAGLCAAFALAFIAESRRPRVSEAGALGEFGLPVLASVNGGLPPGERAALDPGRNGTDDGASYRRLDTQIAIANRAQQPRTLLVVGAEDDESSAHVATKLALTLAHDGRRIVLADVDGRGRVGRLFGLGEPGWGRKVVERSSPLDCEGVTFDRYGLRSGVSLVLALPRHALPPLDGEKAEKLLERLSTDVDLLILHGPSPRRSRGSLTWARAAGATVLVVRARQTSRTHVDVALAGLEPVGANLLGTILDTRRV